MGLPPMTKRVSDMSPEELDRHRARDRERYAKDAKHRERQQTRMREYRRERYATDPEFRERVLERKREYQRGRYANDPEFRERKRAREREKYQRKKTTRADTD
jgi:hypothetical protein